MPVLFPRIRVGVLGVEFRIQHAGHGKMAGRNRRTEIRMLKGRDRQWGKPEQWPLPVLFPAAAVLGSILGWMALEFCIQEGVTDARCNLANTFLGCLSLGASTGMVSAAEDFVRGRFDRAATLGAAGFGVAFVTAFLLLVPSQIVFETFVPDSAHSVTKALSGFFPQLLVGRSLSWGVLGLAVGIGAGTAFQRMDRLLYGAVGGLCGGLVAGLLFDPLVLLLHISGLDLTWPGRVVGFSIVGGMSAFFMAIANRAERPAGLFITSGPDAGKRFLLGSGPCYLGSSPEHDAAFSEAPTTQSTDAVLAKVGFSFVLEHLGHARPIRVNGRFLHRTALQDGDIIRLRGTEILFSDGS